MSNRTIWLAPVVGALSLQLAESRALADPPVREPARTRTALTRGLPPLDGKQLRATLVEVTYEPGGSSPAHSHPCPVMVYVIEGAIRTQVRGEPAAIYRAGDTFYETPHGVHEVSANASDKVPARFLAMFVCDRDTPRTVPTPARPGSK